jgi:uncharacterized protein YkwD
VERGFVPSELQSAYTATVTRQEFCRLAVSWLEYALNQPVAEILSVRNLTANNPFTDTNDPAIIAAFALGITSGTSATTFSPNATLTREQAAGLVRNTLRAAGVDVFNTTNAGFEDITQASSWAVDGINWVRNAGIMSGTSATPPLFSPLTPYTREQSIITFGRIDLPALLNTTITSPPAQGNGILGGIDLGFTVAQVEAVLGVPKSTYTITGVLGGEWYIFRNDAYTNFYMVAFNNEGKVVTIHTNTFNGVDLDILRQHGGVSEHIDPNRFFNLELGRNEADPFTWLLTYSTTGGTGSAVTTTGEPKLVMELTNAYRAFINMEKHNRPSLVTSAFELERDIPMLVWNEQLATAAHLHSKDLFENRISGHTGSDGSSPKDRAIAAGYGAGVDGTRVSVLENVGAAGSAIGSVIGWVQSDGHRMAMRHAAYKDAGVGAYGRAVIKFGSIRSW